MTIFSVGLNKVIILYPRVHNNQSRIFKLVSSLEAKDLSVYVVSMQYSRGTKGVYRIGNISVLIRLSIPKMASRLRMSTLCYFISANWFLRYRIKNVRLYFANSVSVLPIGAFFSGKRGGRLIYAPHELESQRNSVGLVGRYISRLIENIFIRRAHKVVVVGEKIGDWYINEYTLKQRPVVLRNIPNRNYFKLRLKSEGEDYLRDKFQIPQDKIICLYQGIFTKGRGLENIIQVATDNAIQERFVFIFLGFGPYENYIRKAVKVHNNIYFHEAVDFNRLQLLTASADLGLCLIENTCLSYYYSLPNKLFEYIRSGLPVLGSDFPEIEKFILNGGFGWITNPTAEGIRSILYELDNDVIRSKKNSMEVSELNLCWEDDFARMWYMLSPN